MFTEQNCVNTMRRIRIKLSNILQRKVVQLMKKLYFCTFNNYLNSWMKLASLSMHHFCYFAGLFKNENVNLVELSLFSISRGLIINWFWRHLLKLKFCSNRNFYTNWNKNPFKKCSFLTEFHCCSFFSRAAKVPWIIQQGK